MPSFSPVFCRITNTGAIVTTITSGARSATLAAPPAGMVVGEHLFVAKNDHTDCEYLGKITAINSNVISFQFPCRTTRDTGTYTYQVFTPYVHWQATDVPGTGGVTTVREPGIETLDTTGKELIHTKVKEQRDYVEIIFRDVLAQDFHAYKNWVDSELDGGLYKFMIAYMDKEAERTRTDVVKFRQPGAAIRATERAYVLRSWAVELQVVQRDNYLP